MDRIREIIENIAEHYSSPIRVGSRCEANTYYRVEDLTESDFSEIAEYVAERIHKVCTVEPQVIISMPGSFVGLAKMLSKELSPVEPLEVINAEQLTSPGMRSSWLRNVNAVLVNDVITTARSCLEIHTKATMMGASIMCWAAIIDRTFGPGPVPVVAAYTGDPVRLLEEMP